jgi:hypothetical protein
VKELEAENSQFKRMYAKFARTACREKNSWQWATLVVEALNVVVAKHVLH